MKTRLIALIIALGACVGVAVHLAPSEVSAAEEHYSTHGVVKSFGPRRSYVNIAHEKNPGYMEAMTMSFEPRRDDQLAGIEVGAHVGFTFTASDDGRRLLDRIARE